MDSEFDKVMYQQLAYWPIVVSSVSIFLPLTPEHLFHSHQGRSFLCWEHVVTCAYFLFPLKHFLRYSDLVRAVSRIFQLIHSFAAICGWLCYCCCPCMACQYSPGKQRYLVMFFKKIHYRGLALSELTLTYQFVYLTMFSLCSRLKLLFNEVVKRMRLF